MLLIMNAFLPAVARHQLNGLGYSDTVFSIFSEANSRVQPGRKILSSQDSGWTSLLFEKWQQPGNVEGFHTVASPDQTIVFTASGTYDIEVLAGRHWRGARYSPGRGGATAPFNTNQIRWRSKDADLLETLHVYIPPEYFIEALEEYGRSGRRARRSHIDALSLADPFAFSLAQSLAVAVAQQAPDLYADAAARMFASHILLKSGTLDREDLSRRLGNDLTDRRLAKVVEYMHHHFSREITLDELAREASISRFHFVRMFRRRLLTTPYQYLVGLRLQHAKLLLRTTDLDISAVALACGYTHAGRFAAAFFASFSLLPSQFRQQSRDSATR